jgi:hypothetical protein
MVVALPAGRETSTQWKTSCCPSGSFPAPENVTGARLSAAAGPEMDDTVGMLFTCTTAVALPGGVSGGAACETDKPTS